MESYFEVLKGMKPQDKAKAFDILIDEYSKAQEQGTPNDFNASFVNTLDWCVKWCG